MWKIDGAKNTLPLVRPPTALLLKESLTQKRDEKLFSKLPTERVAANEYFGEMMEIRSSSVIFN